MAQAASIAMANPAKAAQAERATRAARRQVFEGRIEGVRDTVISWERRFDYPRLRRNSRPMGSIGTENHFRKSLTRFATLLSPTS
jgi:hypothetical protein